MITVGDPGVHGRGITGMHGIGVNTPEAAIVAAITAGFEGEEHIPNGKMLTIGMKSIMFAAGMKFTNTRLAGRTIRDDWATPNMHFIVAPMTTCFGIVKDSFLFYRE
jgi:hypothetical protein